MGVLQIELPHAGWRPRGYQYGAWEYLRSGGKRCVLRWHRRAGKDELLLHHVACAAMERVGSYWYMLPEAKQARKSMWDAINPKTGRRRIDDVFPAAIRARTLDQEMFIEFINGSTFQLVGSDNYNSLVGSPPVGLVFSEYALSDPSAWAYLMPIIEENGGWVAFNSTPRGKNHFRDLCKMAEGREGWYFNLATADDTGVFTQAQLADILDVLQQQYGEEYGRAMFEQEYYCSFDAALPGSIWGDCLTKAKAEGRYGDFPYVPGLPVYTAWDMGYDDDTAVWFYQVVGRRIRVIRYWSCRFKDVPFMAGHLQLLAQAHGYKYESHWLPHDAFGRTVANGGRTIYQQFSDFRGDLGKFCRVKSVPLEHGLQAARATFPHCDFHAEDTETGWDHLNSYVREYDKEKDTFSDKPRHDASSHAADAFRYLSLSWRLHDLKELPTDDFGASMQAPMSLTYADLRKMTKRPRQRAGVIYG